MNWYSFNPVDTLFFRGAEPMNIGENHTVSANFPPPNTTLQGAVRTAILKQHQISIDNYYNQKEIEPQILDAIGEAGSEAGFKIIGPLLKFDEQIYIPTPYSWFVKDDRNLKGNDAARKSRKKVDILKSQMISSSIVIETDNLYWVKKPESEKIDGEEKSPELKCVGGFWIPLDEIENGSSLVMVRPLSDFCVVENRTGIALNANRSVREGHLYTFSHYRLRRNVELLFGIDKDLPFDDTGILKLGAEQRFGKYQKLKDFTLKEGSSGTFLALSQIKGNELSNQSILASGKIKYTGGWDMKKGFHKPMVGYFPPGSVFKERLDANFIQL